MSDHSVVQDLMTRAKAWIAADPDPATAAELTALVETAVNDPAAQADLADRLAGPLTFGTAGLRGRIGAGENRMNRAVVIRAAAGLAAYLTEVVAAADAKAAQEAATSPEGRLDPLPGRPPRVVIGFDARHGSRDFAQATASVVSGAGGQALLLPGPNPTPLLAYAVRALKADAGVMVTASHNPAQDNGYKVYLGGRAASAYGQGVQIVPPADGEIAAKIAAAPVAKRVPQATEGWRLVDDELVEGYLARALAGLGDDGSGARARLRIVNTSMHGVGAALALPAFARAGFTDVYTVAEQQRPDPNFPTVAFPNPEEPGAIDLALDRAREVEADLVVAHDPDADRCAVAVFDPRLGDWRMLHGDELGALLGQHIAAIWSSRLAYDRRTLAVDAAPPTLACSIVSSSLLGKIAAAAGLRFAQTLTGFKWIARTPGLVFGYEEAIGYCVRPEMVRDKDGLTAGLVLADLAAQAKEAGHSLIDRLDDLARQHGLHLSGQVALRFDNPEEIAATVARIVAQPPAELGGSPVIRTVNLAEGFDGLPPTDGIGLWTADGGRVIVRPSGTEPKVKCYLETITRVDSAAPYDTLTDARAVAAESLDALAKDIRAALEAKGGIKHEGCGA